MSQNRYKVLVLGSSGMLGHMVLRLFKDDPRFLALGTQMNNRSKPGYFNALEGVSRLEKIFKKYNGFDYCINCIGITANKIKNDDSSSVRIARLINSVFPAKLSKIAEKYNCKVVHISTDGVFKGTKPSYDEKSIPDSSDAYGKTKLAGEVDAGNFLNIRSSIIGPSPYEHAGLWEWFIHLPSGSLVNGFDNHIWHGVTTLQFAKLCKAIILKDRFLALRKESSVYHFAPNKPLSKFELLTLFKRYLNKNIEIKRSKQGKGVNRILHTRFKDLKKLLPYGLTMDQAIKQLLAYERKRDE